MKVTIHLRFLSLLQINLSALKFLFELESKALIQNFLVLRNLKAVFKLGTLKILILTSFFGGGLGTLNGWLLSNCNFKFRKVLRICQLIPLAAPAYLITAVLQDLGSIFGYQVTGLWWGVLIPVSYTHLTLPTTDRV